jgi:hypothetical protein
MTAFASPNLSGSLVESASSPGAQLMDSGYSATTCTGAGGSGGGGACTAPGAGGSPGDNGAGGSNGYTFGMGLGAFGSGGSGGGGLSFMSWPPGGTGGDGGLYTIDQQIQYPSFGPIELYSAGIPCAAPGGTMTCVTAETRIALHPTGCAAACELKAGDIVLSRDASGQPCGEEVAAVMGVSDLCFTIRTVCRRSLRCSQSHPVMVPDAADSRGRQVPASELAVGESVLLQNGSTAVIADIQSIGEQAVYLISLVGPNHVYVTNGLWSHNKLTPVDPPPWP